MRILEIFGGILLFGCLSSARAWPAQEPPQKVKVLINDLLAADRNPIWPGYSPLSKSVAVHIKGRGSYLICADTSCAGGRPISGYSRRVSFIRNKAADAVLSDFSSSFRSPEAGDVFLYNYADRSVPEAEMIIVHEMFHLFQQGNFKEASLIHVPDMAGNGVFARYRYAFRSIFEWGKQLRFAKNNGAKQVPAVDDVALAYVEDKLLSQALLDHKNYKTLAAEFVRMREYRRGRLPPEVLAQEIKQEKDEGTAEYVGWKSLADHFSPMLAENHQAGMLLSPQPLANRDRRYYSTGAAQGFLLDRLGVAWKLRVQSGEDISTIMKENFPQDNHTRTVEVLLRELYSDWVKRALSAQVEELAEKKAQALAWLKKYAGWKLIFHKSPVCDGQSRTCYDEPIRLNNGDSYLPACHTELRCSWIDLAIDKPIIDASREMTIFLGNNPDIRVSIDGVKASRLTSSQISKELRLETDGLSLALRIPERIDVVEKTIIVEPVDKNISGTVLR